VEKKTGGWEEQSSIYTFRMGQIRGAWIVVMAQVRMLAQLLLVVQNNTIHLTVYMYEIEQIVS
jgi:hypothetical protein